MRVAAGGKNEHEVVIKTIMYSGVGFDQLGRRGFFFCPGTKIKENEIKKKMGEKQSSHLG